MQRSKYMQRQLKVVVELKITCFLQALRRTAAIDKCIFVLLKLQNSKRYAKISLIAQHNTNGIWRRHFRGHLKNNKSFSRVLLKSKWQFLNFTLLCFFFLCCLNIYLHMYQTLFVLKSVKLTRMHQNKHIITQIFKVK